MRRAAIVLSWILACVSASSRPVDSDFLSPDGTTEVSLRYLPSPTDRDSTAKLFVRRAKDAKVTQTIDLGVGAEDDRNDASVDWSPDSQYLVVNVQVGQLCDFTVYHLVSGRLQKLPMVPIAKKFQPAHRRSRGGPTVQKWLGKDRLQVWDNSSETEFVYLITKENKLQVIAAKPANP
jgi:hypothetical protein